MARRSLVVVLLMALLPVPLVAQQPTSRQPSRLKVFLDCDFCYEDYIRDEVNLVEYVRDPHEADIHVIVTAAETGSGGRERAIALLGLGRFKGTDYSIKALSEKGDTEETQRRRLATALTIGLLNYLSKEGVAGDLTVTAKERLSSAPRPGVDDPWNFWVINLGGTVALDGEESSRQKSLRGRVGADRITHAWKVTLGTSLFYSREDFDLDEDRPLRAKRHQREFRGLIVSSLGDHWSLGASGDINSSSFENLALSYTFSPAVEYNVFPYSAYTRRQLRMNYGIGPHRARYLEETLFRKLSETLARQRASITLEQREPWGSLEARFEASNYLPGFDRHRLRIDGDARLRLARGLTLSVEGSASRLRDQLAIPHRGATAEEILLRLRRLRSRYAYDLEVGLTYTFGSIFNTIVNPRFGR